MLGVLDFWAAFRLRFMPPSFLTIQSEAQGSIKFLGSNDSMQIFKGRSSLEYPHHPTVRRPTYFPLRWASSASIAEIRS